MNFFDFINSSPTAFHTVRNITCELDKNGFRRLGEGEKWIVENGGRYYAVRNSSSVIAFTVGEDFRFNISAAHSDSPCLKLKANPVVVKNGCNLLNAEVYGGAILSSWLDRPLSLAGRVFVKTENGPDERLVELPENNIIIPSLAIHLDRDVNNGVKLDKQNDLEALMSPSDSPCKLNSLISEAAGCADDDILSHELFAVNRAKASFTGLNGEYVCAPRLDDLQCVYASLKGFLGSHGSAVNVFCCFDNEEVGSGTAQGALSSFLPETLERICLALNKNREDYFTAVNRSFMLSADNAHAVHYAHPDKTDPVNCCYMNRGVVIKQSASQKYMTDAYSMAYVISLCEKNNIPYQIFANNSNIPGGSTLGNLACRQTGIRGADIGAAQLAMHSSFETAGAEDTQHLADLFGAFFAQ